MLRDADKLLGPKVEATLAALELADADAALVRLARDYAAALDEAGRLAELAEGVEADLEEDDTTGRRRLAALAVRVNRQDALAQLGPKLMAALDALGASPAARNRIRSGGGANAGPGGLTKLREARRA